MMKRKIILVGLVTALALVLVAPVPALAAKPAGFMAIGSLDTIDEGDPFAAGQSGRWVVPERTITGAISGAITGDFILTYRANVTAEQAGNFHGEMVVNDGEYVIKVNGNSSFGITPAGFPGLILSGHWTLIEGARGTGNFGAWLIPIMDEQKEHIIGIYASAIEMTGQWKP
jgi:hypothetical protein